MGSIYKAGTLAFTFFALFFVAGLVILGFAPVFYGWHFRDIVFWFASLGFFSIAYWVIILGFGQEIDG